MEKLNKVFYSRDRLDAKDLNLLVNKINEIVGEVKNNLTSIETLRSSISNSYLTDSSLYIQPIGSEWKYQSHTFSNNKLTTVWSNSNTTSTETIYVKESGNSGDIDIDGNVTIRKSGSISVLAMFKLNKSIYKNIILNLSLSSENISSENNNNNLANITLPVEEYANFELAEKYGFGKLSQYNNSNSLVQLDSNITILLISCEQLESYKNIFRVEYRVSGITKANWNRKDLRSNKNYRIGVLGNLVDTLGENNILDVTFDSSNTTVNNYAEMLSIVTNGEDPYEVMYRYIKVPNYRTTLLFVLYHLTNLNSENPVYKAVAFSNIVILSDPNAYLASLYRTRILTSGYGYHALDHLIGAGLSITIPNSELLENVATELASINNKRFSINDITVSFPSEVTLPSDCIYSVNYGGTFYKAPNNNARVSGHINLDTPWLNILLENQTFIKIEALRSQRIDKITFGLNSSLNPRYHNGTISTSENIIWEPNTSGNYPESSTYYVAIEEAANDNIVANINEIYIEYSNANYVAPSKPTEDIDTLIGVENTKLKVIEIPSLKPAHFSLFFKDNITLNSTTTMEYSQVGEERIIGNGSENTVVLDSKTTGTNYGLWIKSSEESGDSYKFKDYITTASLIEKVGYFNYTDDSGNSTEIEVRQKPNPTLLCIAVVESITNNGGIITTFNSNDNKVLNYVMGNYGDNSSVTITYWVENNGTVYQTLKVPKIYTLPINGLASIGEVISTLQIGYKYKTTFKIKYVGDNKEFRDTHINDYIHKLQFYVEYATDTEYATSYIEDININIVLL